MTIFVCDCGRSKTGQPYNSANFHKWVCPDCINTECLHGGMVDARDLKSLDHNGRAGSIPVGGTNTRRL